MAQNDLMLEKMKIYERMGALELEMGKIQEILKAHYTVSSALLEKITKQLEAQDVMLRGDGKKDPGLVTRVDRLEQSEETRKWAFRTMIGTTVAMIAKIVHDFLYKK